MQPLVLALPTGWASSLRPSDSCYGWSEPLPCPLSRCGQTRSRFYDLWSLRKITLFNFTKAKYCFAPFKLVICVIYCCENIMCPILHWQYLMGWGKQSFTLDSQMGPGSNPGSDQAATSRLFIWLNITLFLSKVWYFAPDWLFSVITAFAHFTWSGKVGHYWVFSLSEHYWALLGNLSFWAFLASTSEVKPRLMIIDQHCFVPQNSSIPYWEGACLCSRVKMKRRMSFAI